MVKISWLFWCLFPIHIEAFSLNFNVSPLDHVATSKLQSQRETCLRITSWPNAHQCNGKGTKMVLMQSLEKNCEVSQASQNGDVRQRLKGWMLAALVASAVQGHVNIRSNVAHAVTYEGSRSKMMDDQQAVVSEAEKPRVQAVPDKEHPTSLWKSPDESAQKDQVQIQPPKTGQQISLKDFEKLRQNDPLVHNALVEDDSAYSLSNPGEVKRLKKFEKVNEKSVAKRTDTSESVRIKRQNKRKTVAQSTTKNSKIAKIGTPVAGGVFFGIMFLRNKIRMDRERAFVQDNIEKLEQQKAEYFNVTGQALSDDDLMESLRTASGNVTIGDEDMEDGDDEEQDEDETESSYISSNPKRPRPGSPKSGGPSIGPNLKGSEKSSQSENREKGDDEGSKASDEDIEKMKNLFKK